MTQLAQYPALAPPPGTWRRRWYEVIFEHDTPAGRRFDVTLLVAIALSVLAVLLESVAGVRARWGAALYAAEWVFTGLFTIEYLVRLSIVRRPTKYALSFFGIVDLMAILPAYLSLALGGAQSLAVVRALRLLRVFRVLKLPQYLGEATHLADALRASQRKITVFVCSVLTIVLVVGALMYLIEGEAGGFTSIPLSMYWAIVTLTTVGYGDITPVTPAGQMLASALMIVGYGIIAVPTGIVTAELVNLSRADRDARQCRACNLAGHDADARHCKACGAVLD